MHIILCTEQVQALLLWVLCTEALSKVDSLCCLSATDWRCLQPGKRLVN